MTPPTWWRGAWTVGGSDDPDAGWGHVTPLEAPTWPSAATGPSDVSALAPLEAEFAHMRSRERVRGLAEVFTHEREVDAILDLMPDAFGALDMKFLEPACGDGNFLTEILRRKLRLVTNADFHAGVSPQH